MHPIADASRAFLWCLLRLLYRIKVTGTQNIPARGGILAPNHVTFLDAILVAAHVRRPLKFAMYWKIYNRVAWIVRPFGAIPIAPKSENPEIYENFFKEMRCHLIGGGLVCIFPEGKLTTDGSLNEFRAGILKLLAAYPTITVPVALNGLWGTYFSKQNPKLIKWPSRWMSKIEMTFGEPLSKVEVEDGLLEKSVRKMVR
jgi:1-acyl-sn-glycerol-3-phosphate acyltransferase